MKILAFAASNSSNSINKLLIDAAADLLKTEILPGAEVETLDLNDFEMPIYSFDREAAGGVPEEAHRFLARVKEADALLISFPEHNGTVTAAWKNLFDWASRADRNVYKGKPMVLLAATPGPRAGAGVLDAMERLAPFFGGEVRGSFGLGSFHESFDRDARFPVDPEKRAAFRQTLSALALEAA
jgi:NAD(P)H-dependent FMN reductase